MTYNFKLNKLRLIQQQRRDEAKQIREDEGVKNTVLMVKALHKKAIEQSKEKESELPF